MRLGALFTPSDGSDPNHLKNNARALEAAGFDSIWTPQAIGRGFMLPDPLIALAIAASVTERVELGTAILQLPLYNMTDVALKVLSLQQASGGRFILGVGAGSTESDYQVHGLPFAERFSRFWSSIDQLREVFKSGDAGEGNLSPWPGVKGGPPIYFGTWGKNVARAASEFDGWIASGMHRTPEQCAAALTNYREAGGGSAIVSTIQVLPGQDLGELKEKLQQYQDAGFDDAVVMVFPGAASLDQVRALV